MKQFDIAFDVHTVHFALLTPFTNTYYKAFNGYGIAFGRLYLFLNLNYGCHRDYDMLDASFTVLHNTAKKWRFELSQRFQPLLVQIALGLYLMASLSRSHSWMDIWSSGFACIVFNLCIASLWLAIDMAILGGREGDELRFYGISDDEDFLSLDRRWLEC